MLDNRCVVVHNESYKLATGPESEHKEFVLLLSLLMTAFPIQRVAGKCVAKQTIWTVASSSITTSLIAHECTSRMKRSVSSNGLHYVFVPCTNLHKVRATCKNRLGVIGLENGTYGLVVVLSCDDSKLAVLHWVGPASALPSLFNETTWEKLEHNMTLVKHYVRTRSDFTFVNLVDAPDGLGISVPAETRNDCDGGYQMLLDGPDTCLNGRIPGSYWDRAKLMVVPFPTETWKQPPIRDIYSSQGCRGDLLLVRVDPGTLDSNREQKTLMVPKMAVKRGTGYVPVLHSRLGELKSAVDENRNKFGATPPERFDAILSEFASGEPYDGFVVVDTGWTKRNLQIAVVSPSCDFSFCVPSGGTRSVDRLLNSSWIDEEKKTHLLLRGEKYSDIHKAGTRCLFLSHLSVVPNSHLAEICTFKKETIARFSKAYGPCGSMPKRSRANSHGHSTMMGVTGSNRPGCTPSKGPGRASLSQYSQTNFKTPHVRPYLHKIMGPLSQFASEAGNCLFPDHHVFFQRALGIGSRNTKFHGHGTIELVNFGGGKHDLIFWCNEGHNDGDNFHVGYQTRLRSYLFGNANNMLPSVTEYMKEYLRVFGEFDMNTTCAYGSSGRQPENCEVFAFFVFHELKVSIRLRDGLMHSFFGRRLRHCTAVTVALVDNDVRLELEGYTMVGWGNGKTEAQVAQTARERVRRRRTQDNA